MSAFVCKNNVLNILEIKRRPLIALIVKRKNNFLKKARGILCGL
jgi:hypothetical protein